MKGEEKEALLEAKVFCFITQGTWCCQELVSASRQRLAIWDWAPSSESRSSLPACPVCPSLQHMHLPSRIPFWNLLPHPLLPIFALAPDMFWMDRDVSSTAAASTPPPPLLSPPPVTPRRENRGILRPGLRVYLKKLSTMKAASYSRMRSLMLLIALQLRVGCKAFVVIGCL
jgi:hypothetical protein